jgi:hypothetical protein
MVAFVRMYFASAAAGAAVLGGAAGVVPAVLGAPAGAELGGASFRHPVTVTVRSAFAVCACGGGVVCGAV